MYLTSLTSNQLTTLVVVFVVSNMIARTPWFQNWLIKKIEGRHKLFSSINSIKGNDEFQQLSFSSKEEILTAINSLHSYAANTLSQNNRRRKLFKLMSWKQQKLCDDIGYTKKLNSIDKGIKSNQQLLTSIANKFTSKYDLSYSDLQSFQSSRKNASSTNYRVIEALSHIVRDWSSSDPKEIEPILNYVKKEINRVIPVAERARTCIIVPGSGTGRLAYEIAKWDSKSSQSLGAVHAVEYSGLMNMVNGFVFDAEEVEKYEIYPYVHTCSNFLDTESQLRVEPFQVNIQKPENLHLHHEDFRKFRLDNSSIFDNIIVVSVFFIDTAENLVDYFDTIQYLTTKTTNNNIKNGYWINVGPLKYGTASQVELNGEEIRKLRKKLGWQDINSKYSIKDSEHENNGLFEYTTDRGSLWQGFYGVCMWNTARKENERKA
ncbi:Piso0_004123 [Millerozyma farinosa CBS 7064]|uniref:Piso0_004123 protein n=1 Tax=Pichia sorbitophila (strain ATCC MYA-4447 / BCRC 22081 / CBS 7064 / NBRC 10061 / NRRL Y-12695) TaxID=559304 RepID=G8YAG1_PICSO|nr:Piso0_004123 [Millerozyma farinosa CBS 7064]CCE84575.1 Piso0_004123 [Millerozyma farinosa CBS 7064]